jgi:hypothetical protein
MQYTTPPFHELNFDLPAPLPLTPRWLNLPKTVMFTYILIISMDTQNPEIYVDIFVRNNTLFQLSWGSDAECKKWLILPHSPLQGKILNYALECLLTFSMVDLLAEAAANIWQGEKTTQSPVEGGRVEIWPDVKRVLSSSQTPSLCPWPTLLLVQTWVCMRGRSG